MFTMSIWRQSRWGYRDLRKSPLRQTLPSALYMHETVNRQGWNTAPENIAQNNKKEDEPSIDSIFYKLPDHWDERLDEHNEVKI